MLGYKGDAGYVADEHQARTELGSWYGYVLSPTLQKPWHLPQFFCGKLTVAFLESKQNINILFFLSPNTGVMTSSRSFIEAGTGEIGVKHFVTDKAKNSENSPPIFQSN